MIYQLDITLTGNPHDNNKVQREIEIAGSSTLEDLVAVLLESMDFDFDHLYEFIINGNFYEGAPVYAPSRERCRTKILSLGLRKGDIFNLIYDPGDEWKFKIIVRDIINSNGLPPLSSPLFGPMSNPVSRSAT